MITAAILVVPADPEDYLRIWPGLSRAVSPLSVAIFGTQVSFVYLMQVHAIGHFLIDFTIWSSMAPWCHYRVKSKDAAGNVASSERDTEWLVVIEEVSGVEWP